MSLLNKKHKDGTWGGWHYILTKNKADNHEMESLIKEKGDGLVYELLDFLVQDVGITGIFSDWPATVTYYDNCIK